MTHLNTNHHLPVRTAASPMEDAIVQQVEWYMGRVNLEKDEFLKQKMDDDLWVSLDVILNFPKMIRMGVTDKRRVATLLNARSTVVEVDEKTARIRPAWARRSTLVIHNVPVATRREQVAALFHIPSPTADPNSTVPPSMTHPAGLVSIQLYTDTVWVAIFDSPSGAEAALPLVMHKTINGQEVTAEVHVENALPPARSDLQQGRNQVYQPSSNVHHDPANPNHPSYPQMAPMMSAPMMNGQMIAPVPMPMPVMHPGHDLHHQYPYNHSHATYMAPHGYAAAGVHVPRPFMGGAPRGVPHGYIVGYPPHVSFDQAASAMPQSHTSSVNQPPDQSNAAAMSGSSMPADTVSSSSQMPNGFHPSPTTPNGTGATADGQTEGNKGTDMVQEQSAPQMRLDQANMGTSMQQSYSTGMHVPNLPEMGAVPIRDQDIRGAPRHGMDAPYHVIIDAPQQMHGRGRGSYTGGGRDRQHSKNFHDGGSRSGMRSGGGNGEGGRSGSHRKGRKGNRNSVRHVHGHDRHGEGGRKGDGRGEGSGSDSGNREDRRNFKEDKTRLEPNLASMNFPPLPGSESTPRAANGATKKSTAVREAAMNEASTLAKTSSSGSSQSATSKPTAGAAVSPGSPVSSDQPSVVGESKKEVDGTLVKGNSSSDCEGEASTDGAVDATVDSDRGGDGTGVGEKKGVDDKRQSQSTSSLSYAAILRSKKPSGRGASTSVRSNSDSTVGAVDKSETGAASGGSTLNGSVKEKGGKKKKNSGNRNGSANEAGAIEKQASANGNGVSLDRVNSKCSSSGSGNGHVEDVSSVGTGREVEAKAKAIAENTRAHSVWANKPKSLFEAGPVGRPVTPQQQAVKAVKVTSPVSSHEEEKDIASEGGKHVGVNGSVEKGVEVDGSVDSSKVGVAVGANGNVVKTMSGSSESDREREQSGLKEKSAFGEQGGHSGAKGAWAAGGPRGWPKARNSNVKSAKNSWSSEC